MAASDNPVMWYINAVQQNQQGAPLLTSEEELALGHLVQRMIGLRNVSDELSAQLGRPASYEDVASVAVE